MSEDTSGFYKMEGSNLLYAPNTVMNKDFILTHEEHETYKYPMGDWYWFDSEQEAKAFLNEGI